MIFGQFSDHKLWYFKLDCIIAHFKYIIAPVLWISLLTMWYFSFILIVEIFHCVIL